MLWAQNSFSGNAVFFRSPIAKVNKLAAFATKWSVGKFICPLHGVSAGGTIELAGIGGGHWIVPACGLITEPSH